MKVVLRILLICAGCAFLFYAENSGQTKQVRQLAGAALFFALFYGLNLDRFRFKWR